MSGFVLWFTGLSGAGKSTISQRVYDAIQQNGNNIELLDGDEVREKLTRGLGFTREDRYKNIRRIGYVAKLLSRNGVGVISAFITPYKDMRDYLRSEVTNFIEIYVNASLQVCEERDVKGLYKKAREGKIEHFTGISDPYDPPGHPDIELQTDQESEEECTEKVVSYLRHHGYI